MPLYQHCEIVCQTSPAVNDKLTHESAKRPIEPEPLVVQPELVEFRVQGGLKPVAPVDLSDQFKRYRAVRYDLRDAVFSNALCEPYLDAIRGRAR